jgi:Skp family chaperone for outer membrane proteins
MRPAVRPARGSGLAEQMIMATRQNTAGWTVLGLIASMLAPAAQAADPAGAAATPAKPVMAAPPAATAPASSASSPFGGPSIPGLCILSAQALYSQSKVGAATAGRLQQLQQQVQASLSAQKASLDNAAKALAAQQSSLAPAIYAQKGRALEQRAANLQQTAAERQQQLEATRAKAMERINDESQTAIAGVYQSRGCSVVVDRAAVIAGGVGMDITAPVIQTLDAKITSFSFDLERPAP